MQDGARPFPDALERADAPVRLEACCVKVRLLWFWACHNIHCLNRLSVPQKMAFSRADGVALLGLCW